MARRVAWIVVMLAGIGLRVAWVHRPLDHRLANAWREADYVQIARNFDREGNNILYPRIDWRGDTPGFVEMELPLVPWTAGMLYRLFGYHEPIMRYLSAALSVAGLLLFMRLSRRMLPPEGALVAAAAFAVSPLLVLLGDAMQPEPLMLFLMLLAVDRIAAWSESGRLSTLLLAALATGLAAMSKAPAACVGLVLAWAVLARGGARAFVQPRVYVAAILAIVPPLAWYAWTHRFYELYGNSLGVSNETHLTCMEMLLPPRFVIDILKFEFRSVFSLAGAILAVMALRAPWRRIQLPLVWYAAAWAFYLVAGDTTADGWATYYHCLSAAPACLLIGAGAARWYADETRTSPSVSRERWLTGLLVLATLGALSMQAMYLLHRRNHNEPLRVRRQCAMELAPYVPPGSSIVVSGGTMFDAHGHPVAYNQPMMFAWMDHKGFSYGKQERGIATLERLAARGGRYWVAGPEDLEDAALMREANAQFRCIARCREGYRLYDLNDRNPTSSRVD
ncbi:MAG: glycosyltransferase family 39 protein [Gemmatimonadetes bacterium]|nr:glycosyltransferase family 39 protein [Gemmatimonadota bacterium]